MKRYAITHVGGLNLRTLTLPNQGRYHFDTLAEAEAALASLKESLRAKVLGSTADTLEVREVDCYDHGDAKGIYFDVEPRLFTLVKPGTNEVVLGPIDLGNPYIASYPSIRRGDKPVVDLEVGEHAEATYRLSGSLGTYWIVRIS